MTVRRCSPGQTGSSPCAPTCTCQRLYPEMSAHDWLRLRVKELRQFGKSRRRRRVASPTWAVAVVHRGRAHLGACRAVEHGAPFDVTYWTPELTSVSSRSRPGGTEFKWAEGHRSNIYSSAGCVGAWRRSPRGVGGERHPVVDTGQLGWCCGGAPEPVARRRDQRPAVRCKLPTGSVADAGPCSHLAEGSGCGRGWKATIGSWRTKPSHRNCCSRTLRRLERNVRESSSWLQERVTGQRRRLYRTVQGHPSNHHGIDLSRSETTAAGRVVPSRPASSGRG